ncbi:MAG: hypothetical protein NWF02_00405 [Candidatus Bathyarchaeota archaeon]|nr:hypothetical protein [Candidatus Bathyarchaeum sp.]
MSLLKKLEELGYKPKKAEEKEETNAETEDILKNIKNSETKQQILNLLLEALSETDPREILVYGMYVKKYFSPIIGGKQKDNIEKTLELLVEALNKE